jgi:hypothetical protein
MSIEIILKGVNMSIEVEVSVSALSILLVAITVILMHLLADHDSYNLTTLKMKAKYLIYHPSESNLEKPTKEDAYMLRMCMLHFGYVELLNSLTFFSCFILMLELMSLLRSSLQLVLLVSLTLVVFLVAYNSFILQAKHLFERIKELKASSLGNYLDNLQVFAVTGNRKVFDESQHQLSFSLYSFLDRYHEETHGALMVVILVYASSLGDVLLFLCAFPLIVTFLYQLGRIFRKYNLLSCRRGK